MLDLTRDVSSITPRQDPLDGAPAIDADGARVLTGPARDRLLLQGDPAAFDTPLALPAAVGASAEQDALAAMCLGPHEWLLLAPLHDPRIAGLRGFDSGGGTAVDVSHRQAAILVSGSRAATLLNAGCPLDLHPSAFPPGRCTRTVLGKAEIVLWRRGPEAFHLEVARSFAAYLHAFLGEAARSLPSKR